jgi:oligopeptide/dipeptide ABC transporter ATP-binding protein
VAQLCDDLAVMYGGTIVETGPVAQVLAAPRHPYTAALIACELEDDSGEGRLRSIPGDVPSPLAPMTALHLRPALPAAHRRLPHRRACAARGRAGPARRLHPGLTMERLRSSRSTTSRWCSAATCGARRRQPVARRDEIVGLVGESGSGQNDAVPVLMGLLAPSSGAVTVEASGSTRFCGATPSPSGGARRCCCRMRSPRSRRG